MKSSERETLAYNILKVYSRSKFESVRLLYSAEVGARPRSNCFICMNKFGGGCRRGPVSHHCTTAWTAESVLGHDYMIVAH